MRPPEVRKYYGTPINSILHRNSELGVEPDYFNYMRQVTSVDYAIVSPAHRSEFANAAPLLDMPFLFRNHGRWNKVLDSDAFQPIVDDDAIGATAIMDEGNSLH